MAGVEVLHADEVCRLVGLGPEELATIARVFPLVTARAGSMPPVVRIDVPEHRGELDIKAAALPGEPGIAVKVSTGFFDNPSRGLPSLGGCVLVFDATTGQPTAVLLDDGYLTDLRTALAGAVAADHLARADATRAAVVGAGTQARLQVEALQLVRPVQHVAVWARRPEAAAALADRLADRLGIATSAPHELAEATRDAHIIVTTTPASSPVLPDELVPAGAHVTAIGADAPHKQELDPALLARAAPFVCDHREQSAQFGELRGALQVGRPPAVVVELGAVISGRSPGRTDPDAVTVCDLTGTGAQDTAIAGLVLSRLRASRP
ncbi:MAG: hypothetical protein JJT89_05190 [Nitriliruptoraceae bacterium]|nr:hypothetical protein [Nitriliruptoraceae bacterium]